MKKSAIVIDMYASVLYIRRQYNEFFPETMSEHLIALYIGSLVEFLITYYIDTLTKHSSKLTNMETKSSMEEMYSFLPSLLDLIEVDGKIFPWIETLSEFIFDDEYNLYTYSVLKFTMIIVKNDDWRAIEYERMQLDKIDSQKDICLDEWSDKPELIEEYLNSLRRPKK